MNAFIYLIILGALFTVFNHSPFEKLNLSGEIPLAVEANSYPETFGEIGSVRRSYEGKSSDAFKHILADDTGDLGIDVVDVIDEIRVQFSKPPESLPIGEGQLAFAAQKYKVLAWLNLENGSNRKKIFIEMMNPETGLRVAGTAQKHNRHTGFLFDALSDGDADYAVLEFQDPGISRQIVIRAEYRYDEAPSDDDGYKNSKDVTRAVFAGKLAVGYSQCLAQTVKSKKTDVKIVVYDQTLDGQFTEADQLMIKIKHSGPVYVPFGKAVVLNGKAKQRYIFHLLPPQPGDSGGLYKLTVEPGI
jgi:hypothetical protein